jgi:hypothetical protein
VSNRVRIEARPTGTTTSTGKAELTHSFEHQIAEKIHGNLVLRNHHPPDTGAAESPPTRSSTATTQATSLRMKVASALAIDDLGLTLPSALVDDDVIVKGKEQKR